jgi:hypothetical protein
MSDLLQNGGGSSKELPADREKTFEAGLLYHQQVAAERDALREELRSTKDMLARQETQIQSLQDLQNMFESHVQSAVAQRDRAVAERAAFEALFVAVAAQLRAFKIPCELLISEVKHEDTDGTLHALDLDLGSARRAVSDARAGEG